MANKAKYDALIKAADSQFAAKEWKASKLKYQEALRIIHDSYPSAQIAKIDAELQKLMLEQEQREKYDALIAKANTDFGSKKYELSKSNYQEALKLYENEAYPKEQLAKIDDHEEGGRKEAAGGINVLRPRSETPCKQRLGTASAYKSAQQLIDDPMIAQKLSLIDKKEQEEKDAAAAERQKQKKRNTSKFLQELKGNSMPKIGKRQRKPTIMRSKYSIERG